MTRPWVMDNNCVKHHLNQSYQLKVIYPDTHFCYVSTVTLDLGDKTFDQGHDILVGHGHQLCKMLFKSNMEVMSYGLDTDFGYLSTVTLTT